MAEKALKSDAMTIILNQIVVLVDIKMYLC